MSASVPFTRATITLPPDLVRGADRLARRSGASRSAVIADALRAYLVRPAATLGAAFLSGIDSRALVDELSRRLASATAAATDRSGAGPRLRADPVRLAEVCSRHHIRTLSLFGSVLTDEFSPESDVDVLVEFEPGHTPGLRIADIEEELSGVYGGRRVDLVTERSLHPLIRDRVLAGAVAQYAA